MASNFPSSRSWSDAVVRWARTPLGAACGVFAIGILVTAALAALRSSANQRFARAEFAREAERMVAALSVRVRLYEYGLRGTRGAIVAAGEELSRARFAAYARSRDLEREFPGARGFGFIRRVPEIELETFLQRARQDDAPDFSLRVLSAREGERYIIQYIEPVAPNKQAIGLDIASEPLRRAAADTAAESGESALTGPITLVQAEHKPRSSFLFLLPIYKSGAPRDTYEERRAALYGWAYAPLVTEDILQDLNVSEHGLRLTLFDISDNVRPQSFYSSSAAHAPPAHGLFTRIDRPMFGRIWRIEVGALPSFVAGLHLFDSSSVFALGVVLSLLSAALAFVFVQERERAEQLTLHRIGLAAIIESASDAIVSVAADGCIVSWNDAAAQLFGYSAQEALGKPVESCCQLSETSTSYGELLASLAQGGSGAPPPFDAVCRRRDGSAIDVSIAVAPLSSRGGQGGMALTYRDIQERSARERGLRQLSSALEREVQERTASLEAARRDLQNILDALPSMIGYWKADLRNTFANHAYLEWFGVTPEALRGMHMRELLGERIFELNRPYIEAVLRGEPQEFERIYAGSDGRRERHSLTNYVPDIVDREVRGFYAVVHDVTELNRSRENLAAAARENEGLLRTLDQLAVVFVAQPDGKLSYVNEQLCKRSGFPAHALIGQHKRMLTANDVHSEAFWAEMSETLGGGVPWRGELCNASKDGSHYWLDAVIAPFYNSDGQLLKYVCMGVDITAAKAAAAELSRAKVAAEAANAAKTEFVTNMSHEIRTPLNAIIGMTYLLERTALAPEQKQQVRTIQGAGRVLLDLLTDVLDLAKIEAGSLTLDAMSFEPRNLAADLQGMFGPQAEAAKLTLSIEVADDVPEVVRGDSTRCRQILINLVGNAVKFTEHGKVNLQITKIADNPIRLRFSVRDTGPGMSAETLARLFEPFTQADGSTSRRYGGSGLGLSIVKRLVESMGGDLGVKSELGQGSEFWVILPFAAGRLSSAQPPSHVSVPPATTFDESALAGLKLLVTDDSDINRDVAKRILEHVGASVATCTDGMSTLAELRRVPNAYDAILMDVQMPQMDGNETTRRIRSELNLKQLVIIGLTAGALRAERQRSIAAGMNDFLTKPIEPAALIRCIRKHVPEGRLPAPPRMPSRHDLQPTQLALRSWPNVNGLEVREIARDLNYDAAEYALLLSRLMRDGAEIVAAGNADLEVPAARSQLAARVHKLRGSAGVLGAKTLFNHASQLDDALKRDRASSELLPLLQALRVCYSELSAAVAPWIQRVQVSSNPAPGPEPLGELQVLHLLELLQNNDLAALRLVTELSPALRAALGEQRFERFQSAVTSLDFAQAAELVQQLRAA